MNNEERKLENLHKVFKPKQAAQIYVFNVPLKDGHNGFTYSQMRQSFEAGVEWADKLEKRTFKSRFNEGWWNCLESFYLQNNDSTTAYRVMDEAAVEVREIEWAIKMAWVNESTAIMVKGYAKDKLNADIE